MSTNNSEMTERAAAAGLPHWRCVSLATSLWSVRSDGKEVSYTGTGYEPLWRLLRAVDANDPIVNREPAPDSGWRAKYEELLVLLYEQHKSSRPFPILKSGQLEAPIGKWFVPAYIKRSVQGHEIRRVAEELLEIMQLDTGRIINYAQRIEKHFFCATDLEGELAKKAVKVMCDRCPKFQELMAELRTRSIGLKDLLMTEEA